MKFQKKYIISAALILALTAAVYVNWQFGSADKASPSKELGAASYVNATLGSSCDEAAQTARLTTEQEQFFASERNKRKNTQAQAMEDSKKLLEAASEAAELSEAQKSIEQLIRSFTVQDSIESIVKAKGFTDCLCFISDMGVTVIVPDNELNDTSALLIDDAVTSHYNVSYDKISIVGA